MSQIEDSATAYRRALTVGVIEAWLDGKQIQWSADRNQSGPRGLAWYDLDVGSAPDFAAVGRNWRVKPIPPKVNMNATEDCHPHAPLPSDELIVQFNKDGSVLLTTVGEFSGDFWAKPFQSNKVETVAMSLWEDDY